MSWKDLIENNTLKITTADGVTYSPIWKNANRNGDFNASKFDYLSLQGTYVYQGEKPSNGMGLELYFTGENCIEISNSFENSLIDKRPIELEHPYYGIRKIQPIAFSRDDSKMNVSKWNLDVFETIETSQPNNVTSIDDTIDLNIQNTYENISTNFTAKATLNSESILASKTSINDIDSEFTKSISNSSERAKFKTRVSTALRAANNIITDAKTSIDSINSLLEYPATVADTLKSRVASFNSSLDRLSTNIESYTSLQVLEYYTSFGASIINSICKTVINPSEGDYNSRRDVVEQIESLNTTFDTYIANIDANTANDAGIKGVYSPDASTINSIYSTYIYTVANLISLIQDAKVERELTVDKDTNIVLLTHEIYGLKQDDSTIKALININDFRRTNMIQIKKGTKVKYIM